MLVVKHLAVKILMAVNYCGHQLARSLGWAAPAYHKKEGESPHPLACKHSLLYDGWPEGRFGMQIGTWNFGSLSGNVCEKLRKRMIDVLFTGGEMERTGYQDAGDERKEIKAVVVWKRG